MHFKIDRSTFLNELYSLQGVASSKQVIPILSHVLVEAGADRIVLRATDLDLTITTECEAYVRKGGSVCLPARKMMEIAKSLTQGEIEIKTNELHQAEITSNGSRFKLKGGAADNFPELQEYSGEYTEIPAALFSRLIPRVIYAAGQEGSRYSIHGAKLEISGERIRMVATDGHRLALIEREEKFSTEFDVLIPRKTLSELAKLCATTDEMLQIAKADNHIHFKIGQREIVSCLLAGQYPDYAAVLPKENRNRFTVGRELISPAINRVALMADDRQHTIKLEISKGKLHVSSQTAEIGEAGETVAIEYGGQKITTGFNASYLNDFLNAIDEDEVLFEFKNGNTAAKLSTSTSFQDHCLVVVMPMRL
ncbi:MAG TPA: DNA polymerase III subunit beta [Pyrinomonadaceae bacterium]|nr:DNA polymerase III subunit beta [Pyrinomonadaceae bacterium]